MMVPIDGPKPFFLAVAAKKYAIVQNLIYTFHLETLANTKVVSTIINLVVHF